MTINFEALKGVAKVVFTKKDGERRTMYCTQSLDIIPVGNHPKGVRQTPSHLKAVFDLEAKGWRSFIIANVISCEPYTEE